MAKSQPKVHLRVRNEAAWDAYRSGVVDKETATNQTKCGYVRSVVTTNPADVTCKHCLREMEK